MSDPAGPTRRGALAVLGAGALATVDEAVAAEPTLATPQLRFVLEATVLIGTPLDQGLQDGVRRRIVPITGGRFAGPHLSGEVLPGGADWQSIRGDGTTDVHARYTLRADDGAVIDIDNPGIRRGPVAVLRRIAAGEVVDPSLYYFRTTPRFTTPPGPHAWLAEGVFVGTAARYRDHVVVRVFALT